MASTLQAHEHTTGGNPLPEVTKWRQGKGDMGNPNNIIDLKSMQQGIGPVEGKLSHQ